MQELDHLFCTVRPAGRCPYIHQEVSGAMGAGASECGAVLSVSAIRKLRGGRKTSPTMRTIESLARFFGVGPEYFFLDGPPPPVDPELQWAVGVPQARALAPAALSGESRDLVRTGVVRPHELVTRQEP